MVNPNTKTVKIQTVADLVNELTKYPPLTEVKLIASDLGTGGNCFFNIDVVNKVDDLGIEIGSTENLC